MIIKLKKTQTLPVLHELINKGSCVLFLVSGTGSSHCSHSCRHKQSNKHPLLEELCSEIPNAMRTRTVQCYFCAAKEQRMKVSCSGVTNPRAAKKLYLSIISSCVVSY